MFYMQIRAYFFGPSLLKLLTFGSLNYNTFKSVKHFWNRPCTVQNRTTFGNTEFTELISENLLGFSHFLSKFRSTVSHPKELWCCCCCCCCCCCEELVKNWKKTLNVSFSSSSASYITSRRENETILLMLLLLLLLMLLLLLLLKWRDGI